MATHSSILVWRILWTEEPGELYSMGSQRVRHTPSTQCGEAGQQGTRTWPAGKKGDRADLQDHLLSSLRHGRKAMTGGPAWSLGTGGEPPQWPEDDKRLAENI